MPLAKMSQGAKRPRTVEGTTGNSPYHDKVATEGFSSAFYTTCFGFRKGWRLLHFFAVNELHWKSITFSGAVTYSQSEMSIQPLSRPGTAKGLFCLAASGGMALACRVCERDFCFLGDASCSTPRYLCT
jgi:hypothetical protein